jgi:molybdopterin molybdotransferase
LITIEDAWELIENHIRLNESDVVPVDCSVGRVVSEPITCEFDSPPFDKSLVDGYAVSEVDVSNATCTVVETVVAGEVAKVALEQGGATRIMTGCPLPKGSVGVVMVEETVDLEDGRVRIQAETFQASQNVLQRGKVIRAGQELISQNQRLRPHDVGALCEFGIQNVQVFKHSSIAVLATGNELVDSATTPAAGQIRNSNGPMLVELVKAVGGQTWNLGIGPDVKNELNQKIKEGLQQQVLLIAGGVSAGIMDLVPQCLKENGVKEIFHKVDLKPGKPLWFGRAESGTLVFGLPGNPISSLVCFKLFVEPLIKRQSGQDGGFLPFENGVLKSDLRFKGNRTTFWPCQAKRLQGRIEVLPLDWKGSADQATYCQANALIRLDGPPNRVQAGDAVSLIWL